MIPSYIYMIAHWAVDYVRQIWATITFILYSFFVYVLCFAWGKHLESMTFHQITWYQMTYSGVEAVNCRLETESSAITGSRNIQPSEYEASVF